MKTLGNGGSVYQVTLTHGANQVTIDVTYVWIRFNVTRRFIHFCYLNKYVQVDVKVGAPREGYNQICK